MKKLLAVLGSFVVFMGCGEGEGSGPPAEVKFAAIVSFSVDRHRVEAGDTVTVSWEVQNARELEILANGVPVDFGGKASGTTLVAVHEPTIFLLEARGQNSEVVQRTLEVTTKISDLSPVILAFEASPDEVDADQVTTLSWITRNASSVSIFDGAGSPVPTGGAAAEEGSIEVRLSEDGNYRLVAEGAEGITERSLFVKVRGSPDAELLLSKATVVPGEPVILSWSVREATRVLIREVGGKILVDSDVSFQGAFEVTPQQTTTYELRATGAWMDGVRTATVDVIPELLVFEVMDQGQIGIGKLATLRWVTKGAMELRLSNLEGYDETITGFRVAEGTTRVPMGANGKFRLEALGGGGKKVEREASAEVQQLPSIGSFSVTPSLTTQLAQPVQVLVSWTGIENADEVKLIGDTTGRVGIFRPPFVDGDLELWLGETANFSLVVVNGAGETTRHATATLVPLPDIRTFSVSPRHAGVGETVQVAWDVVGAETVGLEFNEQPLSIDPAAGTATTTFTITEPGNFQLFATNSAGGTVNRRLEVTVGAPAIRSFASPSTVVLFGDPIPFQWVNLGGTQITLKRDGVTVFQTDVTEEIESGGYVHPGSEMGRVVFSLELENGLGEKVSQALEIMVTDGPVIQGFDVDKSELCPQDFATLDWSVSNDPMGTVPTLTLTGPSGPIDISSAHPNQGSFAIGNLPPGLHAFTFTAATPGRNADSRVFYVEQIDQASFQLLSASPEVVSPGQSVTISWETICADGVEIAYGGDLLVPKPTSSAFVDVRATGTLNSFTVDCSNNYGVGDEGCMVLDFPNGFTFPFDGASRSAIKVFLNGFAGFDLGFHGGSWISDELPFSSSPWMNLAPFWLDMWEAGSPVGIYTQISGSAPNRTYVIQWSGYGWDDWFFEDDLNFQIVLYESGMIEYRYGLMESLDDPWMALGEYSIIGYQNTTGTVGHNISAFTPVAGGLSNKAYRYGFPMRAANGSFTITPTTSMSIPVTAFGASVVETSVQVTVQ